MAEHGARPRPAGGVELYAWLFMRISGILLLALALGHLFIMHVFNSVHTLSYDFVAARYLRFFWRGYDLAMLWLAMIHGLNGIRTLFDDYLPSPARGFAVKGIYLVGLLFLALGTWVIIAFRPVTGTVRPELVEGRTDLKDSVRASTPLSTNGWNGHGHSPV